VQAAAQRLLQHVGRNLFGQCGFVLPAQVSQHHQPRPGPGGVAQILRIHVIPCLSASG
jgi:hypothetical protein